MSRPLRVSSAALASTANAFSSPIRPKAELIAIKAAGSSKAAPFGKAAPAEDIIRRCFDLEAAVKVGRHRLAQRRDSGRVGIAVLAVAQRLDGGLDDMGWRFEVGLADAEIDDVAPLALQFGRLREHRERVLLPHPPEGGIDCDQGSWLR